MEVPEKEYVDNQITALRREVALARESHEREHAAHVIAHERDHMQAQTAIEKSEAGMAIRFASVNEFRQTLSDQTNTFITREAVDNRTATITARLERFESEINRRLTLIEAEQAEQRGQGQGQAQFWGVLVAAVTVLLVAAGVAIALLQ